MKDELREKIAKWFIESVDCEDPHFFPSDKARYWSDQILSLIERELEKARKCWMARRSDGQGN